MLYVIGIDEVGRGSLAGPVAVCAVCLLANLKFKTKNLKLGRLRDSKKLTEARREKWFEYFKSSEHIRYEVARVYSKKIDKINISRAANLAADRALTRLISRHRIDIKKCAVFLDGGLYVGSKTESMDGFGARTIIKGDEKITAIKIASIIAKVTRDRRMKKLSKIFPDYGFEAHKGYGTKHHIGAIKKFGICPVHRLTFLKKLKLKTQNLKVI